MLERLSVSADSTRQKVSKAVGDRLHVFGSKKQVPFHIVISELRAELMNTKQHAAGSPCTLLWVRGDTVHVTEDSVGKTVLSWSDTYFAQVVPLQVSGHGFRPKECKFKVQQKTKTIAKTAVLDLAKYCSDLGLARDQSVAVPLQPSGTLYFVISTAPASEQQQQQGGTGASSVHSSAKNLLARDSCDPSVGGASTVSAAGEAAATAVAAKYGGAVTSAASAAAPAPSPTAASAAAAITPPGSGGKGGRGTTPDAPASAAAASPSDDADRPSTSNRGHSRKPSGGLLAAAMNVATRGSPSTPASHGTEGGAIDDERIQGTGVFKRKVRGGAGSKTPTSTPATAFAAVGGAAASTAAAAAAAMTGGGKSGGKGGQQAPTLRKSDSDHIICSNVADIRNSWDAERSLSQAMVGTIGRQTRGGSGSGLAGAASRAIRSFTTSASARSAGPASTPLQLQLPQSTLDGISNLNRHSGAVSTCSDTAAAALGGKGACAAAVEGGIRGGGSAAAAAAAGSAGSGWGAWLRGGLGWGRSSNHSATGTSTGPHSSTTSLANGAAAAAAAGQEQHGSESSALEAAITSATEVPELREIALDLLHERDEWRSRALTAQDAMGRAQAARGSAVREAQRLEVRVRQYQDELCRRTDGSLVQELVEAKVRIAELANENMKLRRQITHMGPLFYDDSGDEGAPDGRS